MSFLDRLPSEGHDQNYRSAGLISGERGPAIGRCHNALGSGGPDPEDPVRAFRRGNRLYASADPAPGDQIDPPSGEQCTLPTGWTPTTSFVSANAAYWITDADLSSTQEDPAFVDLCPPSGWLRGRCRWRDSRNGRSEHGGNGRPGLTIRAGTQCAVESHNAAFRRGQGVKIGLALPGELFPGPAAVSGPDKPERIRQGGVRDIRFAA